MRFVFRLRCGAAVAVKKKSTLQCKVHIQHNIIVSRTETKRTLKKQQYLVFSFVLRMYKNVPYLMTLVYFFSHFYVIFNTIIEINSLYIFVLF